MSSTSINLRDLLRPGVAGVRANWRPFILLQLAALAVVVGYYQIDAIQNVLDALGRLRDRSGYLFAAVSSAFAGAVLPEVAKLIVQPQFKLRERAEEVTFLLVLFFFNGMLVDALYRTLATIFGSGTDFGTAVMKMLADMLVFTPFIALPLVMFCFAVRRHGYRLVAAVREIAATGPVRWYLKRVVPLLLPNWAFWTPMVLLIYSMPAGLQIATFAGALSAWSLVMVFIGNAEPEDVAVTTPAAS